MTAGDRAGNLPLRAWCAASLVGSYCKSEDHCLGDKEKIN